MYASLAQPDEDVEIHWFNVRASFLAHNVISALQLRHQGGKTRCTAGSVVSSLYHLKDSENRGEDAAFFVFPDLSVRMEGSYRLKLSLFEVVGCIFFLFTITRRLLSSAQNVGSILQVSLLRSLLRLHGQEVPRHGGWVLDVLLIHFFLTHLLQSPRSSLALWLTKVSKFASERTFAREGVLWSPLLPNRSVQLKHHPPLDMHLRRPRTNQRRRKVVEYA